MSLEIVPFELYRLAARYEQTKSIRRNCLKYPANPPLYVEIWKQFTGIRTGAPSPLFQKRSKSATDDWSKWRAVSMREKNNAFSTTFWCHVAEFMGRLLRFPAIFVMFLCGTQYFAFRPTSFEVWRTYNRNDLSK